MASKADHFEEAIVGYEPGVRREIRALLTAVAGSGDRATIEAMIKAGDLTGLADYVSALYIAAAAPALASLLAVVKAGADLAAVDIREAAKGLPPKPGASPGILFQGAADFGYNPVSSSTISATRTWQGNLIREMGLTAREGIMETVRRGILAGENPRTIARQVKVGLPLTQSQQRIVQSYHANLRRIADDGIRSATTWGIYTPRQIAALKAENPRVFKALNFSAKEMKEGRRWAKISRAAGTLGADAKGRKGSKALGLVDAPETQGGANAYRIGPDGKPLDAMSMWRLRDKTFDPLIYDIVAAHEAGDEAAEAAARARFGAKVDIMATRYRERMVASRAENIARTETMRAANLGSYEAWRQSIEDSDLFEPHMVRRIWRTARDDRVRPSHRRAADQKVGMTEPFHVGGFAVLIPPAGPRCLPGDALVTPIGGVSSVFVRDYLGEFVVIETIGGRKLTITPNHPCLTSEGWIAAEGVEIGDELLAVKGRGFRQANPPHAEPDMQKVADLAQVLTAARPCGSDFHGDAVNGEIAEVFQDIDLMAHLVAGFGEGFAEFDLPPADVMVREAFPGIGGDPLADLRIAALGASGGVVSRGDLLRALVTSHAGPLDPFLLGGSADLDTGLGESFPQGRPADTEGVGQRLDAFAALVERDKVVEIRRVPANGHVFNLETSSGTYIAQGVIVHNCRCHVLYDVDLTGSL